VAIVEIESELERGRGGTSFIKKLLMKVFNYLLNSFQFSSLDNFLSQLDEHYV